MEIFQEFYQMGLQHILGTQGYDHIIFVIALCAIYQPDDWKNVLVLVTAFTVGHSITLALAIFDLVSLRPVLVEFLIPMTIFLTAFFNLFVKSDSFGVSPRNYFLAAFFGMVHGLGFANYLHEHLTDDRSIGFQLFAFNVGIEVGQAIIVGITLAAAFLVVGIIGVSRRDWKLVISSAVAGIAAVLVIETGYLF